MIDENTKALCTALGEICDELRRHNNHADIRLLAKHLPRHPSGDGETRLREALQELVNRVIHRYESSVEVEVEGGTAHRIPDPPSPLPPSPAEAMMAARQVIFPIDKPPQLPRGAAVMVVAGDIADAIATRKLWSPGDTPCEPLLTHEDRVHATRKVRSDPDYFRGKAQDKGVYYVLGNTDSQPELWLPAFDVVVVLVRPGGDAAPLQYRLLQGRPRG